MAGLLGSFFGGSGDILIKVGADVGDAVKGLGEVHGALDETAGTGARMQKGIEAAAVPAAAALAGLGAAGLACAKAAASAEESQKAMEDQIRRSTGATQGAIDANNEWLSSYSRQVALSQGELRPALAGLVRSTGELSSAQELLTLSADTAAATHKDLATVSAAVGKAYNGNYGSLKRLVPSISDAAIKSGDWATVQAELNKQVGGAAQESAKTTEGQYRLLTLQMKGLQVAIGKELLPVFSELVQFMIPLVGIAKENSHIFNVLGGVIAAVAGAVLALNAALKIYTAVTKAWTVITKVARAAQILWTAAQWALNVAMTANPIGLVIVAIGALVVAFVVAYKKSATFRSIVNASFHAVVEVGKELWHLMAPFIDSLEQAWGAAKTFGSIVAGVFSSVWNAIKRVIDLLGSLASKVGSIHLPHIPGVNVAAYPVPMMAPAGAGTFAAETGQGMIVNVTVTGAIDPESSAIQIKRILERYDRRRGRRPLGGEPSS